MLKRILIVEDQAMLSETLADLLSARGYSVDVAGNGEEALEKAMEQRPDVILLDVSMPVLDGPATLVELRRRPEHADTPVVMMSASEASFPAWDGGTLHQARLRKPFSDKQLLAAVAGCIDSGAHRRAAP